MSLHVEQTGFFPPPVSCGSQVSEARSGVLAAAHDGASFRLVALVSASSSASTYASSFAICIPISVAVCITVCAASAPTMSPHLRPISSPVMAVRSRAIECSSRTRSPSLRFKAAPSSAFSA